MIICTSRDIFLFTTALVMISTDLTTARECSSLLISPGYTEPKNDILVEYGNPLEITCIINDEYAKEYSSKDLFFVRNGQVVPSDLIQEVNSSAIKLRIEKPSKSLSIYVCRTKDKFVCMNNVIVDSKPIPVIDFACVSYNYEELKCTFTQPENYARIKYILQYYFPGRASRFLKFSCPELVLLDDRKTMSCYWTIHTEPQYRQAQPKFIFELTMTNVFGTTTVNKTFLHFQHVLPGPPENLVCINKTSESIYLQWSIPPAMQPFPSGLQHRILYRSIYDNKWKLAAIERSQARVFGKGLMTFNLTGLKGAYCLYDIRVSMRSNAAIPNDESMWSTNSSIKIRTEKKVPGSPPLTNIGSFEILSLPTNKLDENDIYVYWQQIGDELKNDENVEYYIKVDKPYKPYQVTKTYAIFKDLKISNNYTFWIWSSNSVGKSENFSVVFVPQVLYRINNPISVVKVDYGGRLLELSWQPPINAMKSSIKNYTVFWCIHNRDRPYQCDGYLDWKEVPRNSTSFSLTVPTEEIYQFAISANTETTSSGVVWADRTILHDKFTKDFNFKTVWVDKVGSTFIQLAWMPFCTYGVGEVKEYLIHYCSIMHSPPYKCEEPERFLTVPGGSKAFWWKITNLSRRTSYMLAVSSVHTSVTSETKEYVFATTL